MQTQYYINTLLAYVRGHALKTGIPNIRKELLEKPLDSLSDEEVNEIFEKGKAAELKLYRFKNTHDELPRVKRVIGFLKGVTFDSLLDVGSGRGVFLFPFLNTFPWVRVTSFDILDYRVEFLNEIALGGVERLSAVQSDICESSLPDESVDVVTMLEVLEHIPNVADAVRSAVKIAKQFVIVTVPSKEDSNPEHIHLLTKEKLTRLFTEAGCASLSFGGVNGHLFMIANVGKDRE